MWSIPFPLSLYLFALHLSPAISTPEQPQMTFEDLFQAGKVSYTEGNWPDCVAFMRRAMEDFRYLEDELVFCRQKCHSSVELGTKSQISQWHAESERAICLLRCKRERLTEDRPALQKMTTYFDFMERKPYEYMHFCYWKMGELSLAVQSAYTFLVRNPGNPDMLHTIDYYMKEPNFDETMLVDAMRMSYEIRFIAGVQAYNEEDWGRCSEELEQAVEKLLAEDDRCRLLCHDKIDWSVVNGNPEIEVLLTSMRSSVIHCEHNCLHRLSLINGHQIGHPLAAVYEYLHYCQYKLMRGTDAAQSVANYLLFDDNPLMRRNKYFYLEQYKKEELFTPTEKMVEVFKKRSLEERYLTFVEEKFKFENNEFPAERADDRKHLDLDVSVVDSFDYSMIPRLLTESECAVLRSTVSEPAKEQLVNNEHEDRIGKEQEQLINDEHDNFIGKEQEELIFKEQDKLMSKEQDELINNEHETPSKEQDEHMSKEQEDLINVITGRVRQLWPNAIYSTLSCSAEAREATCARAIVLSVDESDCSEWLGKMHTGCSMVFCA